MSKANVSYHEFTLDWTTSLAHHLPKTTQIFPQSPDDLLIHFRTLPNFNPVTLVYLYAVLIQEDGRMDSVL